MKKLKPSAEFLHGYSTKSQDGPSFSPSSSLLLESVIYWQKKRGTSTIEEPRDTKQQFSLESGELTQDTEGASLWVPGQALRCVAWMQLFACQRWTGKICRSCSLLASALFFCHDLSFGPSQDKCWLQEPDTHPWNTYKPSTGVSSVRNAWTLPPEFSMSHETSRALLHPANYEYNNSYFSNLPTKQHTNYLKYLEQTRSFLPKIIYMCELAMS